MIRLARLTLPILLALTASSIAARAEPHAPAPAANCFWVHGRLSAANGAPTFRIWRIGTKRVLGVVDAEGGSDSAAILPDSVRTLVAPDAFKVYVMGDFRVCPLAADRPGHMRMVRVVEARRLITHPVD